MTTSSSDNGRAQNAAAVLEASAEVLKSHPNARIFVFIETGPEAEPTVFASGDDEAAADLLFTVGEWLDADDEDNED
jgi:hypothetical protein